MSATLYSTPSPTPVVTRRSPGVTENVSTRAQRSTSRRSLGGRLRNLFRKNSSSPTRTTSNERSVAPSPPPTTTTSPSALRQTSASPVSVRSTSEAPQLRAPTISWPFGKKKNKTPKTPSTPKPRKTKSKDKKKTGSPSAPPTEISSPIYQQQNQSSIQGQVFVPRTPQLDYSSTDRIQSTPSVSYYDTTPTKGFRDYAVVDQSQPYQQVIVPEVDAFTPPTHTSDRSRSPSMNRQRFTYPVPNEYYFHNDNVTSTVPPPLADIEVIPTPQRTRQTGNTPLSNTTNVLIEKPPMSPKTTSRPPSTQPATIGTNRSQSRTGSSSTLNNAGIYSSKSLSIDGDTPKLTAPTISFGSSANKKEKKRAKSQTRTDRMTSSTTAVNKLGKQDPSRPDQSWAATYGSLPDAEIIRGVSLTPSQPLKSKANRYPGLSAIVQHHFQPSRPVNYNERPFTPTSPTRTQRFDTSTTTLNEFEDNSSWSRPVNSVPVPPTSTLQRHDGYIRPLTPQHPFLQADISINIRDADVFANRSPPATYRTSATVYTRDRRQFVDGGEIRTWSSQENNINTDSNNSYTKTPSIHVPPERPCERPRNEYEQQIVPPKAQDNYDEYRYSPRAHEEELYIKEQKTIDDQEVLEEERYEVSYEYEQHHQQYLQQTQSQYDELHTAKRYTSDMNMDQNSAYSNYASTLLNERDQLYDQPSRSYLENEYKQETQTNVNPVSQPNGHPHTYTVKRSDSYDGLGLSLSTDSQTRTNHIIRDVEKGSPAAQAGLRVNDRLISVNGVNVENIDFGDVLILVREGLNNDNLQLSVLHETD